jgi:hypothetical protein
MSTPTIHREPAAAPAPRALHAEPVVRGPDLSRGELAFIVAIPAAWGILLLFHPIGGGDFYAGIDGEVTAWLAVHIGMGVFVPLFAGAVFLLLRGVDSTAATVSRIGLAVFAILYAAWELVLGVGTGILTDEVNALPRAQRGVGADLVDAYAENGVIVALSVVGSLGLLMAMIGAALALRRAYRIGWAPFTLLLLATPLIAIHEPPFGPIGLAMFIGAVILLVRRRPEALMRSG